MANNIKECKYCLKKISLLNCNKHLRTNHIDEYNEQVQLVKQLLFDDNFSEKTMLFTKKNKIFKSSFYFFYFPSIIILLFSFYIEVINLL